MWQAGQTLNLKCSMTHWSKHIFALLWSYTVHLHTFFLPSIHPSITTCPVYACRGPWACPKQAGNSLDKMSTCLHFITLKETFIYNCSLIVLHDYAEAWKMKHNLLSEAYLAPKVDVNWTRHTSRLCAHHGGGAHRCQKACPYGILPRV